MLHRLLAICMVHAFTITIPVMHSFGQMRCVIDSYEIGEINSADFASGGIESTELHNLGGRLQVKPDTSFNGEIALVPLGLKEFKLLDLRTGNLSIATRPFPNPNINGIENSIRWVGISPRGGFVSAIGNDSSITTYSVVQEEGGLTLAELPQIPAAPLKSILPALLDNPARLVVIETGSKGLLLDTYELPSMNKTSKRVQLPSRLKVQWVSVPAEDRITATLWDINQMRISRSTTSMELFEVQPSPHPIVRTASHRWASLKHGTSLNSFLDSWPTGEHRLTTLELDPLRRTTYEFRHPIVPDSYYTVIKTTPSGRKITIGTARDLRSTSAKATIFVSDESMAPEVRTFEFPIDIFSAKPIGFTTDESGLIVACYRYVEKLVGPDMVRISVEIVDLFDSAE